MRKKCMQMSFADTYDGVVTTMEEDKPKLISLLEEHIDFGKLIPPDFRYAFYHPMGRPNTYHLVSFIKDLVVKAILGLPYDTQLIDVLKLSDKLTDFCGFSQIPDGSQFTRFRQNYADWLATMFNHMVELTEPICRKISENAGDHKADYLLYDTTGIELQVVENNPKTFNALLKGAKTYVKDHPDVNPYGAAYNSMPTASKTNPDAKQQYINGHFCYALKMGLLTNGLGIPRYIAVLDEEFLKRHPDIAEKKTDNPAVDKEVGDSTSLRPVLSDFYQAHPNLHFGTFIGDASFDSYDIHTMLHKEFHFDRTCIPMNPRNAGTASTAFDENGTPLCPVDGTPFEYVGVCKGKHRSQRDKWVCHKSEKKGSTRVCTCEHPCTNSQYGRCVYTHPDKNYRLYPGIPRGTEHWDNLYKKRVVIERAINQMKDTFALDARKSHHTVTAKADIYLVGIVQLVCVLLADAIHDWKLWKSIRRIVA